MFKMRAFLIFGLINFIHHLFLEGIPVFGTRLRQWLVRIFHANSFLVLRNRNHFVRSVFEIQLQVSELHFIGDDFLEVLYVLRKNLLENLGWNHAILLYDRWSIEDSLWLHPHFLIPVSDHEHFLAAVLKFLIVEELMVLQFLSGDADLLALNSEGFE